MTSLLRLLCPTAFAVLAVALAREEADVVEAYADAVEALRGPRPPTFARINRAVSARLGEDGLDRIKAAARERLRDRRRDR